MPDSKKDQVSDNVVFGQELNVAYSNFFDILKAKKVDPFLQKQFDKETSKLGIPQTRLSIIITLAVMVFGFISDYYAYGSPSEIVFAADNKYILATLSRCSLIIYLTGLLVVIKRWQHKISLILLLCLWILPTQLHVASHIYLLPPNDSLVYVIGFLMFSWGISFLYSIGRFNKLLFNLTAALFYSLAAFASNQFETNEIEVIRNIAILLTCAFVDYCGSHYRWVTDYRLYEKAAKTNFDLCEKNDLLNRIAHEFNIPLSLMSSPLQRLKRSSLSDDQLALVETLEANTNQLISEVSAVVEWIQRDNHRLGTESSCEITEIIFQVVNRYYPNFKEKSVELQFLPPECVVWVKCNPQSFATLISNLISNAFKFTRPGGVVQVQLSKQEDYVEIQVSDTGIGIASESLDRIFSPFEQAEDSSRRAYGGLGLGLSVTRKIVHSCSGTISVVSTPGKGTVFTVMLPVYDELHHDQLSFADIKIPLLDPRGSMKIQLKTSGPKHDQGELIYVVDDEPAMNREVSDLLREEGYHVRSFTNPDDAILSLNAKPFPKVVILDYMMPRMNGLDFLERMQALEFGDNPPKVLMFTAASQKHVMGPALEKGAIDFIQKPYHIDVLIHRVRNAIKQANMEIELRASITELRTLQASLEQDARVRAIYFVVSNILHEINNPINHIHMASMLLTEEDVDIHELQANIQGEVQRVVNITSSLRNLIKNEEPELKALNMLALCDRCLSYVRPDFKKTTVNLDISKDLNFSGIEIYFVQAVVNFLRNSARAIIEKGRQDGLIDLRAQRVGSMIELTIEDNGGGVAPGDEDKLQSWLYTRTMDGSGTGLGIWIARYGIEQQGGDIKFTNYPGRGLRVDMLLRAI